MHKNIEIMVAGRSKPAIAGLQAVIASPEVEARMRHISNGHSNPLYGVDQWPEILIMHLSEIGKEEITSLLENPEDQRPATIIVGPADNMECMRLAMQVGVRDYLHEPLDEAELTASIDRICRDIRATQISTKRAGMITAVVSAKGGAGGSFVAANLAHIAVSQSDFEVALLDLDLQFGSLAQYLDLSPENGLMHALDMADHLDAVAVDAYMAKHRSGLRLLSPLEDEIILSRDIVHERFVKLLELVKASYDRVYIDLPRQIDELSADVYERADNILLVTQQELASIRDARRLYKLILRELSISPDRVSLVVNRYDKSLVVELDDICRSVGISKERLILVPNSYENVAESINVGVPIYDHSKNSRVTRALQAMNERIGGAQNRPQPNMVRRVLAGLIGG